MWYIQYPSPKKLNYGFYYYFSQMAEKNKKLYVVEICSVKRALKNKKKLT